MSDTPIYTFDHQNGEHTTVEMQHGEHVSLRAASVIVHRVDENGKRTGRTVFPYASMKSYHVEYPTHTPDGQPKSSSARAERKRRKGLKQLNKNAELEEARRWQRARDNELLQDHLKSSGMCIGPWNDGQCHNRPVIHPEHGYVGQGIDKDGIVFRGISDESIEEVRRVTEMVAQEEEKKNAERNLRNAPERHVLDIVEPRDPDPDWPGNHGGKVG